LAELSVRIDDEQVLAILERSHGLNVGDSIRRATEVEFDSRAREDNQAQGHVVEVTLKFMLTREEVDSLIR
jgi:hypothetical protein